MPDSSAGETVGGIPQSIPDSIAKPRESLITTAVSFLTNQTVQRSPLPQKQKFLRSKGLTEDEIQIACERAGVFTGDPNSTIVNMTIDTPQKPGYMLPQQLSPFQKIKEILNSIALFSGLIYAAYLFYKRYIEPYLFGRKKKKTVEESIQEMDSKIDTQMKKVSEELTLIREEVRNTQNDSIPRDLNSFKNDLEAIKGLLLNRKQFANPISVGPPMIPAWQLTSQTHSETEHDKNDDAGSGSGSSETEVVTKNSDSSLEIM